MKNILITGASGFVGKELVNHLVALGYTGKSVYRSSNIPLCDSGFERVLIRDINEKTDWTNSLKNIDCVIHLAARVHVMQELDDDPLSRFRKANTQTTLNLAKFAAKAGVKRLIYISSIKVNGEFTAYKYPFKETDIPNPSDSYAISKYEAEQGLMEISNNFGMEVTIIRPPLVYGPGVKANFFNMMNWLSKGIPLPFASINNKRSLVGLDNLLDLIVTCIEHPLAANQVFLVSDDDDLSTSDLLCRVAQALGKKPYMVPINQKILHLSFFLLGKRNLAQRICGSLQVDVSKAKKILNWTPPVSVDEGLRKTAKHFIETRYL